MARQYEVGDRVKLDVTEDNGSHTYYFGWVSAYNSEWEDDIYQVTIEGKGEVYQTSPIVQIESI